MTTRREFLGRGALAAALLPLASGRASAEGALAAGGDAGGTVTPDGATLAPRFRDGARIFRLFAEPVTHEFAPGLRAELWGYNGRVHGPTLELLEGERTRIYVTNRLPVPTTVHWHGVPVPSGMDGVSGLTQRPIEPGETFLYEFTPPRAGTFLYHSHHDEAVQMAMGLMGLLIVHPRASVGARPDRDYAFLLQEWAMPPGARRPDPNAMEGFNLFTLNGKAYPATSPIVARVGERVRIRFGNLSAVDHHPMHLHGPAFRVVETDGGAIPASAQWPETTVLVPVGTTRTIELTADLPGDWALHCHMTHHTMNQMGHGLPNLVGADLAGLEGRIRGAAGAGPADGAGPHGHHGGGSGPLPPNSIPMLGGSGPYGPIGMGGMFTILKVRESLGEGADPGWHQAADGARAEPASPERMRLDGIDP